MEERNIKRIRRCRWVFCFLMVLLAARLFFLQISSHDELASAAVSQYEIPVIGFDTRGRILDRNYMPLTGGTYQYYYVISRQYETDAGQPDGEHRCQADSRRRICISGIQDGNFRS